MSNVIISADSTCDLSPELVRQFGIRILPLHVTIGERTGSDGVDITPADLFDHFKQTGELPKTSACTPAQYADFFRPLTEGGAEVVHFSISSAFSSTHQNAVIAAEEIPGVHCVDSRNLSTGIGLLVLKAADLAAEGLSAAEIAERCAALTPKVDTSFVLDTLAYLRAGGRCTSVAAIGASVLSLKPSIIVSDGTMHVGKKYIATLAKALQKYIDDRLRGVTVDRTRVFVTHTAIDPAIAAAVVAQVKSYGLFDVVLETEAGCTVSSHCGPGCLGVLFIHE